MRTISFDNGH